LAVASATRGLCQRLTVRGLEQTDDRTGVGIARGSIPSFYQSAIRGEGPFRGSRSSCTIWYVITDSSVEIDAPATVVWEVFTDVERWPEWTASVTRLVALDGPGVAVGKQFAIKQPRMPKLVWEVTEVTPGTAWTWVQRSPGGLTLARHEVIAESDQRTRVRQQIDQRGPVGALVGLVMRGMTKRYLELEASGLKARSEQLRDFDGPAS
jgi:uncharacterized membrane protein